MGWYRTCDIRGTYPDEINEELCYHFGQAIALKLLATPSVIVGCDVRPSSLPLKEALVEGLTDAGAKVFDCGRTPTAVVFFGKRKLGTYAAVVTASHNPPEDNGLKLQLGRYPATAAQLRSLKPTGSGSRHRVPGGSVEAVNLADLYIQEQHDVWGDRFLGAQGNGPLAFVLDPGNGAWTLLAHETMQRLGITARMIHAEPDGRFPNRSPDCAARGALKALCKEVRRSGASAGIAWDGDGDRVAICDETGRVLSTDQLVLLLLPEILKDTRRERVLYDVKMSKQIRLAIEAHDAVPVLERSAHCYLETRMISEDCLFGCECSGHFFFRQLDGGDDGMHAALVLVDFLRNHRHSLSQLLWQLPPLFITPDIRIRGDASHFVTIRKRVVESFSQARISYLDGVRVETDGGWFLIRPAVSESKLSFRFEGETSEKLTTLIEQVQRVLPEHSEALGAQVDCWGAAEAA